MSAKQYYYSFQSVRFSVQYCTCLLFSVIKVGLLYMYVVIGLYRIDIAIDTSYIDRFYVLKKQRISYRNEKYIEISVYMQQFWQTQRYENFFRQRFTSRAGKRRPPTEFFLFFYFFLWKCLKVSFQYHNSSRSGQIFLNIFIHSTHKPVCVAFEVPLEPEVNKIGVFREINSEFNGIFRLNHPPLFLPSSSKKWTAVHYFHKDCYYILYFTLFITHVFFDIFVSFHFPFIMTFFKHFFNYLIKQIKKW